MPKISEETWETRRLQILDAAWRCFQREGLQGTRMEHIVAESKMANSAMYRYFKNKEDIIECAIKISLNGISSILYPVVDKAEQSPVEFLQEAIQAIEVFSKRSGFNLMSIAIHGWSEAQRNPKIRSLIATFYDDFQERLVQRSAKWQAEGHFAAGKAADPAHVLFTALLGYVVSKTLLPATDRLSLSRGLLMFEERR